LLGGQGVMCASGQDDINLERNQFGRMGGEPLELPLGISIFNHDVATLDVTEATQSLAEGLNQGGTGQVDRQVAYSSDFGRLLGARGDRPPNRRATNKRGELPPPHATPPPRSEATPKDSSAGKHKGVAGAADVVCRLE
jgi:hypothetical protein